MGSTPLAGTTRRQISTSSAGALTLLAQPYGALLPLSKYATCQKWSRVSLCEPARRLPPNQHTRGRLFDRKLAEQNAAAGDPLLPSAAVAADDPGLRKELFKTGQIAAVRGRTKGSWRLCCCSSGATRRAEPRRPPMRSPLASSASAWARPGCLRALSVLRRESILYGGLCVGAHGA